MTIIICLVWWALILMEQAVQRQEFSRMLAGMLVVASAAGVLTVHFLIGDYFTFVSQTELVNQQADLVLNLELLQ
ncbi:hypothetical protein [Synechococcus sp. PCC 7336]|uniref:hypothetical protein n=1 Tax=Synechococcus sp. PCC 7336 TaxID=195250 RepID=UPI001D0D2A68|nr:hypothetical protein [Synechococcus sp. PCC 7336]